MSNGCGHDCGNCNQKDCPSKIEKEKLNIMSHVGKVFAVMSAKGGVGKSLITSMLAVNSQRRGHNTAILDADILGPSIPKAFGVSKQAAYENDLIIPVKSKTGIQIISINCLMENAEAPVIWRGPVLAGAVKQFWSDVYWEADYMFIDMPPGTGDVPLTIFQSLPIDGIIIVTSPQELVSLIVAKGVNMAKSLNIPIVGLVENMSYFICPDCKKQHQIFGDSHIEDIALKHNVPLLAKLPIMPQLAKNCDSGLIELYEGNWLDSVSDLIEKI